MNQLVSTILAFVAAVGLLIVVHEFGHFYVARRCGVRVLRFSLGFGKSIWRKRFGRDRTEFSIGLIPFGGYVKMLDEREMTVNPQEVHRAFNRQSLLKRSAIVVAGPAANFLLAIAIYWCIYLIGSQELMPILGSPPNDTPAAMAGILNGEQVAAVDGKKVRTWEDFRWVLLQKAVTEQTVELELINERNEIAFRHLELAALSANGWQGDGFERLGLRFFRPAFPAVIGTVAAGSPADRAGLQVRDEIVGVGEQTVGSWQDFVELVRASGGAPLRLEIKRGEERLVLEAKPEASDDQGKTVWRIGIGVLEPSGTTRAVRAKVNYGVLESGGKAIHETWQKSIFSLVMLGKMITGDVSWRTLSGPVTIADYAGQSARMGADYYLKFIALVSISLGVLNLLPLPILDGGHLMYHMLEFIKRGPLSERFLEVSQQLGIFLLLIVMSFAFYNDIHRLISG